MRHGQLLTMWFPGILAAKQIQTTLLHHAAHVTMEKLVTLVSKWVSQILLPVPQFKTAGMVYLQEKQMSKEPHNKALKAASLDVSSRRMLRILRAACSRPLALR